MGSGCQRWQIGLRVLLICKFFLPKPFMFFFCLEFLSVVYISDNKESRNIFFILFIASFNNIFYPLTQSSNILFELVFSTEL